VGVDVVIVGAGVAGLSAAVAARAAGLDVVVLEARDRVGGRLLTLEYDGAPLDLGATWCWAGEGHVDAMLRDLVLPTFDQWTAGDGCYETERGIARLQGNPIDVPARRYARGAAALADALAAQLPAAVLYTGVEVRAIAAPGDSIIATTADGRRFTGRRVILALPPALAVATIELADDLVGTETRRIAESTGVWMGQIVKVVCCYDEPFWRRAGLAGSAISTQGPLGEIHDMSGPDGTPAALFGFAMSEPGGDLRALVDRAVAQLGRMFGPEAAKPREAFAVDWATERYTSPASPHPAASTATFGHPAFQPSPDARLLWASTETARVSPGHVDGAIWAGFTAAKAL
jgi:monoamine oxidase